MYGNTTNIIIKNQKKICSVFRKKIILLKKFTPNKTLNQIFAKKNEPKKFNKNTINTNII